MDTERRSMHDRRRGRERRNLTILKHFFIKTKNRGDGSERRQALERRWGWVRVSKWGSVHLASLKLSKFLRPDEHNRGPKF